MSKIIKKIKNKLIVNYKILEKKYFTYLKELLEISRIC